MTLTKEQIEFLDKVCVGCNWKLNSDGEVDVDGAVDMRDMNLTEIPVKFGSVGDFSAPRNNLTTLKNLPMSVGGNLMLFKCSLTKLDYFPKHIGGYIFLTDNNLTNYFKNIKEEDFPHWDKLNWCDVWRNILEEYPFLINIGKKYTTKDALKVLLERFPQTKLYYEG